MTVKTWKVLDYGVVPQDGTRIAFTCPCGVEAEVPVAGRAIAQVGAGVVFDNAEPGCLPPTIQCRKCRRILTTEGRDVR